MLWLIFSGGSTACCQGTNPSNTADAICGYFFDIDNQETNTNNVPICGTFDVKKTNNNSCLNRIIKNILII